MSEYDRLIQLLDEYIASAGPAFAPLTLHWLVQERCLRRLSQTSEERMTISPCALTDEEEMVATLKGATALHILQRRRVTATQLAEELGCTTRHAYRVLERLELSHRFAIVYNRPFWHIGDDVT